MRAVSEVIASLLLVAITVVGGIIIFAIVSDGPEVVTDPPEPFNVKIIGFDTRDGTDLSGIAGLDNTFDKTLTGGSEYIVLTIRNPNFESVQIHNVMVDLVTHTWDETTAGQPLSSSPGAKKFSIVSIFADDITFVQQSTTSVNAGSDVKLVIKLGADIKLYEKQDEGKPLDERKLFQRPITIDIGTGTFDTKPFVIPAGSTG